MIKIVFLLLLIFNIASAETINIFAPPDKRGGVASDDNAIDANISSFEIRGAISTPKFTGLMIKVKDKKLIAQGKVKENFILKKGEKLGEYTFVDIKGVNAIFKDTDNNSVNVKLLTLSSSKNAQKNVAVAKKTVQVQNSNTSSGSPAAITKNPHTKNVANSHTNTATKKKDYMPGANNPDNKKTVKRPEQSESLKSFIEILKKKKEAQGNSNAPNPFINLFNK